MELLVSLIAIAVGSLLIYWHKKSATRKKVEQALADALPMWALLGPFGNGEESSLALRIALTKKYGQGFSDVFSNSIQKHQELYDKNPRQWEDMRVGCLAESTGVVIDNFDHIKNNFRIATLKGREKEEACVAYGAALLNDQNLPQASSMIDFLQSSFMLRQGKQLNTPSEIGNEWLLLFRYTIENQEDELAKRFTLVNYELELARSKAL